tara:strand:+ start:349 stop:708 length:360 start_codon:yes stop_codon:yes gene_type:complete
MKITKKRLREILTEEVQLYVNSIKSQKIVSNLIFESKKPNYSPKLGFTLTQFIMELEDEKQLTNVKFVKEENGKMVFSTTTPAENNIVQSLDAKVLDDGAGKTLLLFNKEKGVDTTDEN